MHKYQIGDEPVPGFRLAEFLGRGGFGEVWKATAPGKTFVALKIIALDGKQGSREFAAIRLVKLIRHPNLVPIISFWLKDGYGQVLKDDDVDPDAWDEPPADKPESIGDAVLSRPTELVLAMGLGDQNLLDRMKECQAQGLPGIPPAELLGYLEDAARAIDYLNTAQHDLGSGPIAIQHCDIKPQNILIVGDAAQVCDFGLAHALGLEEGAQAAAGSPAYASPEVLTERSPTAWTDQYSLAISYVELHTGRLPFAEQTFSAVIQAHCHGELDLTDLSAAEQEVVRKATSVEPDKRYPSTLHLIRALKDTLDEQATDRLAVKDKAAQRPTASVAELRAGLEIVPGYRLIKELFQDNQDEVWEATAPGGKHVALLIRDLRTGERVLDLRALALVHALEHKYLTELHAYWLLDENGQPVPDELRVQLGTLNPSRLVIAGKLARKTLQDRLRECPDGLPGDEAIECTWQLAEGIDFLNAPEHRLSGKTYRIAHRGVRPWNVMYYDDIVRLGNFSFAVVLEGDAPAEAAAVPGAEAVWQPPEAERGEVTVWSDQYALAVLYHLLRTGHLPETGDAAEPIQADASRLTSAETQALRRATSPRPEDRFSTCGEFSKHLAASMPTPALNPARQSARATARGGGSRSIAESSPAMVTTPELKSETTVSREFRETPSSTAPLRETSRVQDSDDAQHSADSAAASPRGWLLPAVIAIGFALAAVAWFASSLF